MVEDHFRIVDRMTIERLTVSQNGTAARQGLTVGGAA